MEEANGKCITFTARKYSIIEIELRADADLLAIKMVFGKQFKILEKAAHDTL